MSSHDKMIAASYVGKVVRLAPQSADDEIDMEVGMLGYIARVDFDNYDVFTFHIDTRAFDEHNTPLLVANYYDKNGVPCLTAKEAGHWEDVAKYYIGPSDIIPTRLEIIGAITVDPILHWEEGKETCFSHMSQEDYMKYRRHDIPTTIKAQLDAFCHVDA